jgi:hypothetical protein
VKDGPILAALEKIGLQVLEQRGAVGLGNGSAARSPILAVKEFWNHVTEL